MNLQEIADRFVKDLLPKLSSPWIVAGLLGQVLFTCRFIVQWIASERKGRSVIPIHFWFLSLGGSTLLLIYALHIADPVFILAYLFNGLIYVRNLMLIHRENMAKGGTA